MTKYRASETNAIRKEVRDVAIAVRVFSDYI
jgi:hypothetical protein